MYRKIKKLTESEINQLFQLHALSDQYDINNSLYQVYMSDKEWELKDTEDTSSYKEWNRVELVPIPGNDQVTVHNVIPKHILDIETPNTMSFINTSGGDRIGVHIDRIRKTAVNIYLNVDGSETCFYEPVCKPSLLRLAKTGDGKDRPLKCFPDMKTVNKVASFIPERGDVYILDVSTPHSVENISDQKLRTVITADILSKFSKFQE